MISRFPDFQDKVHRSLESMSFQKNFFPFMNSGNSLQSEKPMNWCCVEFFDGFRYTYGPEQFIWRFHEGEKISVGGILY